MLEYLEGETIAEREREREKEREKQREREKERDREKEKERNRETERLCEKDGEFELECTRGGRRRQRLSQNGAKQLLPDAVCAYTMNKA